MKKLLSFIAALAMFSLVSCSDGSVSENAVSDIPNSQDSTEYAIPATEKTELTLALTTGNPDIWQYITKFNASDSKYKIVCVDYSSGDKTKSETENAMKIDIISGNPPDMMLCSDTAFYRVLANKDLFMDISYIYDESNILPNIRKICTEDDGKIYRIPLGFQVSSAYTSNDNGVDCCEIYNYSIIKNIMDNLTENEVLAYDMRGAEYCTRYSLIHDFTNLNNHTCNFSSEEFIDALDFYRNIRLGINTDNTYAVPEMAYINLGNVIDLSLINKSVFGDDTVLTPPEHAKALFNQSIGIYSFADEDAVKGTGEFIGTILSDDCVNSTNPIYFPITESGLDIVMGISWDSTDENGQKIKEKLSDSKTELYKNYLKSVTSEIYYDSVINGIFQDETLEFINNEISAEVCAERIQSRVGIYLSEQY